MLLGVVVTSVLVLVSSDTVKEVKPLTLPVPFEFPFRNERADQCWLRIEDLELTDTFAIYCYIAHGFLQNHIHSYNSRKMTEDKVVVSLWVEKPRHHDDMAYNRIPSDQSSVKDWKSATILDPITHMRIYVSKNAQCRIIMYSRDGMSNYLVDCEMILFYLNDRMSGTAGLVGAHNILLAVCIFFAYLNML